jgi:hypothetical protein
VGLVATLENDHIRVKKIDNDATNKFISMVAEHAKSPAKQYTYIGELGEKLGLKVVVK